jgi:XTP/dITP diphosphohydrolase
VKIWFLTNNDYKHAEMRSILSPHKLDVQQLQARIDEIQTEDMEKLVEDKTLKAFEAIKRPVFVDHTGLTFDLLEGLPGGLTEIFWNKLKNRKIAELIGQSSNPKVTARTYIGYCDGRKVYTFVGTISGTVPREPRGPEGFQWDPIFVPNGHEETFAEMGAEKKNEISMRRKALDSFISFLEKKK